MRGKQGGQYGLSQSVDFAVFVVRSTTWNNDAIMEVQAPRNVHPVFIFFSGYSGIEPDMCCQIIHGQTWPCPQWIQGNLCI